MQQIIKDAGAWAELEKNGYVVVPFLNESEVRPLVDFFYAHHSALPDGMYATSHSADFDFRKKMNNEIKQVLARAADVVFQNCALLGATFMVKSRGENGSLEPHQDWSIVDESVYRSYNIWLPLVDVNEDNGTLLLLPRSHNWIENTRGLNIPSSFRQVIRETWQYLIPAKMKAGDALIYDHRLLHASGKNKTSVPRLTIVYGLVPADATMRYYLGTEDKIEEYECTADFYFNEVITQGPAGLKKLRTLQNSNPLLSSKDLFNRYAPRKSLIRKIISVFKS